MKQKPSQPTSKDPVDERPLAIALMGPTASGKTALAFDLYKRMDAEVISVDSALVYRGLDIGAAKPTASEQAQVPHSLIDIRDPADSYSVADFCHDCSEKMEAAIESGKTPLLVGGTMMYFKALLEGLSAMPAADENIRQAIAEEAERLGWPHLHSQLAQFDPEAAARIHPNHSRRISRAVEVYKISGKTLTEWQAESEVGLLDKYRWVQLAIAPRDRQVLHERIGLRFDKMLESGFESEVKALMARGNLTAELPSMRSVGYRQMWQYLEGEYDYESMRQKGLAATRQLAKRQLTWLRGWHDLSWVYTQDEQGRFLSSDEILQQALKFLLERPYSKA